MKIGFMTLGCKVNQYETEVLREEFLRRGYDVMESEDFDEPADIYVINTCTVTNLADRKSRQYIRRAKAQNPDGIVAVTGCYAQVDPDKVAEIPGVDIIAGTNEKQNLPEYIEEYIASRSPHASSSAYPSTSPSSSPGAAPSSSPTKHILEYEQLDSYCGGDMITSMGERTRAYIKIQEGCNRFCSYCIIPYARGKIRSRGEEEIINEITGLVDSGFKEIVLTGINTALYGAENGDFGLMELLDKIDRIPGDFRVRLSSLEPTVVSLDNVSSILGSRRLCNHLHLSIQSGSDDILRSMRRNYTRDQYMEIVSMLRDRDPKYGLTTDIIVGFPGEKDADFEASLDLVRRARFNKVHVFRYSPRRGTKAAEMDGQVPSQVKSERAKELTKVAEEVALQVARDNVGDDVRVLLEEEKGGYLAGYSDNYLRVYVESKAGKSSNKAANKMTSDDFSNFDKFVKIKLMEPYRDGLRGSF